MRSIQHVLNIEDWIYLFIFLPNTHAHILFAIFYFVFIILREVNAYQP